MYCKDSINGKTLVTPVVISAVQSVKIIISIDKGEINIKL